jgi:hypothetical protein
MYYQNRYKLVLFVSCFFFIVAAKAQSIGNSAVAEQKSLQLYQDKDWQQLTKFSEKAIGRGYDYFYIRMRAGIACFEQKKYIKAIRHFEKAVQFNSDTLALEYLYYSYVFAGRANEARALTASFPLNLKSKIKPPKNKLLESIYTEGGIGLSNLSDKYNTIDIDGSLNIYGESTIMKNMQYWHIGTSHQLGKKWSLYQGYSNIGIDFLRDIKINNKDTSDAYHLVQHDYYISTTRQFKRFSISPAFHFINVNFAKLNAAYDKLDYKYIFTKKDTSFINYAISLSLSRSVGIFTYGVCTGYAQLNGYTQLQAGVSVSYFPFANTDFYGSSLLVYLNESGESRTIVGQKFGVKLLPKVWAEAGITYGNLQNYCENNAFVIFNTGDKIVYKYGGAIVSPISRHLELSLRYDCFNRENTYYQVNSDYKTESASVIYKTQTIVGGLKWTL